MGLRPLRCSSWRAAASSWRVGLARSVAAAVATEELLAAGLWPAASPKWLSWWSSQPEPASHAGQHNQRASKAN